jgi:Heterokaryon incompatibility protein (HET)
MFKSLLSRFDKDMSSAASTFPYRTLDPSNKEIRLLSIQPEQDRSAPIRCRIQHARLQDSGEYVALSYTWGDPQQTRPIYLNEFKVEVTINLEEFLREIHSSDGGRTMFWIDAVCINQQDLAERSSQVLIMKDIYSNAQKVIAWLGREQAFTKRAFDFVEELAKVLEENVETNHQAVSDWIVSHTSPLFATCSWMALAELLNQSYWRRAWIVQEVVLSQETIIMGGKCTLPWGFFRAASLTFYSFDRSVAAADPSLYTEDPSKAEYRLYLSRVARLSDGIANVERLSGTLERREQCETYWAFYDIIRRHRKANSTDPLDKVYAFLGLTERNDEIAAIPVDYILSAAALFRMVTRCHVEAGKGLYILNDCYGIGRPAQFSSWTPCHEPLRIPTGILRLKESAPNIIYKAALDMIPRFQFDDTSDTLLLDGVRFDMVRTVGATFQPQAGEIVEGLKYTLVNVLIIGNISRASKALWSV